MTLHLDLNSFQPFLPRNIFFSDARDNVFLDLANQATYSEKMSSILNTWGSIAAAIPPIWLQEAKNEEIPFDLENSLNILNNCTNERFWSAP
ncbi:HipA family kinase [Polynucleobacter necessarius]|uniref:HipA family kinase n=1 Tax=Polynucleobacter necessarius TaxID=576610 RepID=UPI0039E4717A